MPEQSHFNIVDNCVCTSQTDGNAYQKNESTFTNSIINSLSFEFMHYFFIIGVWIQIYLVLKLKLKPDSHCNKINSHNISPFRIAYQFTELTIGFIFTVALILFHFNYTHTHRHHSLTYIHKNSQPYTCMQLKHMHTCTLTFMCPLSHTQKCEVFFLLPLHPTLHIQDSWKVGSSAPIMNNYWIKSYCSLSLNVI